MRAGTRHLRNNRGFSILEGLIAIGLFFIGILATVAMLDVGFNAGTLAKSTTTATELAAFMQDRIRFETISQNDPFAKDRARLLSFNGLETDSMAPPATEPAATIYAEWRRLVQENLPAGWFGRVTVTQRPNLPLHYEVRVELNRRGSIKQPIKLVTTMVIPL